MNKKGNKTIPHKKHKKHVIVAKRDVSHFIATWQLIEKEPCVCGSKNIAPSQEGDFAFAMCMECYHRGPKISCSHDNVNEAKVILAWNSFINPNYVCPVDLRESNLALKKHAEELKRIRRNEKCRERRKERRKYCIKDLREKRDE